MSVQCHFLSLQPQCFVFNFGKSKRWHSDVRLVFFTRRNEHALELVRFNLLLNDNRILVVVLVINRTLLSLLFSFSWAFNVGILLIRKLWILFWWLHIVVRKRVGHGHGYFILDSTPCFLSLLYQRKERWSFALASWFVDVSFEGTHVCKLAGVCFRLSDCLFYLGPWLLMTRSCSFRNSCQERLGWVMIDKWILTLHSAAVSLEPWGRNWLSFWIVFLLNHRFAWRNWRFYWSLCVWMERSERVVLFASTWVFIFIVSSSGLSFERTWGFFVAAYFAWRCNFKGHWAG